MIAIYLAFLHLIADFVLQSRDMGKQKSEKILVLIQHCCIQFYVVYGGLLITDYPLKQLFYFAAANAIVHGIIDWNIWRVYKSFTTKQVSLGNRKDLVQGADQKCNQYRYWDDHYFYLTIGVDQFLHIATLISLWYFIVGG